MDFLLLVALNLTIAAVLLGGCIIIEHIATIERYTLRQRIPGLLMNLVGTGGFIVLSWPLNVLWHKLGVGAVTVPLWDWLSPLGWAGLALQFLALLILADFLAYWRHRAEHKWLWFIHVVHHSPTELHAANNIGHPLQAFIQFAFVTIPLSLIQVNGPEAPFAVGLTVLFLAYYVHSPIDFHFGRIGRFAVVDNRFHRIHHSLEPRHFDKNFGICFSCWDWLFGTAYDPGKEWPKVGVEGTAAPLSMQDFLALPFRTVRSYLRPKRYRVPPVILPPVL